MGEGAGGWVGDWGRGVRMGEGGVNADAYTPKFSIPGRVQNVQKANGKAFLNLRSTTDRLATASSKLSSSPL